MDDEYSSLYHVTQTFCCDWSCAIGQFEADVTQFQIPVQGQCDPANPLAEPFDVKWNQFQGVQRYPSIHQVNELCHKLSNCVCSLWQLIQRVCWCIYNWHLELQWWTHAYIHSVRLPNMLTQQFVRRWFSVPAEARGCGACSSPQWIAPSGYLLPAYARNSASWTLHLNLPR